MSAKMPIVFDVETKYTFRDFNDHKKLGVSVVAAYDYATQTPHVFLESEINQLFRLFEQASCIIGFNISGFDLPVLSAYYPGNINQFPVFDIMEDVRLRIGRRLALNDLISTTLNKKKTGHGLQAIEFYKAGKWDELKQYCKDDTMLTKELFDYGVKHSEIFYLNERGKIAVPVQWSKWMQDNGSSQTTLILPF